MLLGEGFGLVGGLPVRHEEKGKGVGRLGCGVGTGNGIGKLVRTRLSKPPFSKLPFRFSPKKAPKTKFGWSWMSGRRPSGT